MKSLAVIVMCLAVSACSEPGAGRNYERAKKQAQPVVKAIELFRVKHNSYPRTLDELVPAYLDAKVLQEHVPGSSVSFYYRSGNSNEYKFEFDYSGPGRNSCSRNQTHEQGFWECKGHY